MEDNCNFGLLENILKRSSPLNQEPSLDILASISFIWILETLLL
jgi:hypothetical protein